MTKEERMALAKELSEIDSYRKRMDKVKAIAKDDRFFVKTYMEAILKARQAKSAKANQWANQGVYRLSLIHI